MMAVRSVYHVCVYVCEGWGVIKGTAASNSHPSASPLSTTGGVCFHTLTHQTAKFEARRCISLAWQTCDTNLHTHKHIHTLETITEAVLANVSFSFYKMQV